MSLTQFRTSLADALFGATPKECCVACKQPFSTKNVFTPAGWNETGISRMCEACFDKSFADE